MKKTTKIASRNGLPAATAKRSNKNNYVTLGSFKELGAFMDYVCFAESATKNR